jgi:hypothetical protein
MEALSALITAIASLGLSPGIVLCLLLMLGLSWGWWNTAQAAQAEAKAAAERFDAAQKEAGEKVQAALQLVQEAQDQTRDTNKDWSSSNKEHSEMLTNVMTALQGLASSYVPK